MNIVRFCTLCKLKLNVVGREGLQVVNVGFELRHEERERSLEVVVLHLLSDSESVIVEVGPDLRLVAGALREVVVELPHVVPVLNHRGVETLGQDLLVVALASSEDHRSRAKFRHVLAYVRVDHAVEKAVVGC
jgi:hypothetical protein